MLHVIASLALIALGMGMDALYQRKIRIAECNAYETGYQQGKKEERIREDALHPQITLNAGIKEPSMAAPVAMPDTFAERLRKHGRATVKFKGSDVTIPHGGKHQC